MKMGSFILYNLTSQIKIIAYLGYLISLFWVFAYLNYGYIYSILNPIQK